MPLHDWTRLPRWSNFHKLWIYELFEWLQPRLPEGYRAYMGTLPALAVGGPPVDPDVHVERWRAPGTIDESQPESTNEPEIEVAVKSVEPASTLYVEQDGWIVAALEVVSPGNKDRNSKRTQYTGRYASYLAGCINLTLIDVVPKPREFSFADAIAAELEIRDHEPLPTPYAVSYRYNGPSATGGSAFGIWRRRLAVGSALPTIPLALSVQRSVIIDLEATYLRAAGKAYLE